MGGILEEVGKHARVQQILIYWVPPLLIGSLAFVIIVLPDIRQAGVVSLTTASVDALHVNKFLFLLIASIITAVFLQINRIPLWRVLEGYAWPTFLKKWRIFRAHFPQCRWLQASLFYERAVDDAELAQEKINEASRTDVSAEHLEELQVKVMRAEKKRDYWQKERNKADHARQNRDRGHRYRKGFDWLPRRHRPLFTYDRPADARVGNWTLPYPAPGNEILPYPNNRKYSVDPADTQIKPTLLGNAMRVMETYGANNYGLDSQSMWYELLAEAPSSLQDTLEEAQLVADTLVCSIYTAAVLACAAAAGGAWRAVLGTGDTKLWVTASVSVVAAIVLYRRLLSSVDGWASAVMTLVNSARGPLCEKYGLQLPETAEEEKCMWKALTSNIFYGPSPQTEAELAKHRKIHADQDAQLIVNHGAKCDQRRPPSHRPTRWWRL